MPQEIYQILITIFCAIAIAHCLFLSVLFLKKKPFKSIADTLVAFLLIALSMRISKSVFFYLFFDLSLIPITLGLAGLCLIGPLLVFLLKAVQLGEEPTKIDYLHFLPAFLVLLFGWFFNPYYLTIGYWSATIILSFYIFFSWFIVIKRHLKAEQSNSLLKSILISMTLIWGSFVFQIFSNNIVSYIAGTAIASVVLYWINYVLSIFSIRRLKNKNSMEIPEFKKGIISDLIRDNFINEEIYRNSDLTLSDFSRKIEQPVYLISRVVNEVYNKKFPEFVNYHRIEEAKKALVDNLKSNYTIESIAYEVGFNTPSAFYTAFKKETGLTPNKYIEKTAGKKSIRINDSLN